MSDTNGNGLQLRFKRAGRAGKADVSATLDGKALHVGRIDAMDPDARHAFTRALAEKCPGLDEGALDDEMTRAAADVLEENARGGSVITGMLMACCESAELFHAGDAPYATVAVNGHTETHSLDGRRFKTWLRGQFYAKFESAPKTENILEALGVLAARALFDGPEIAVAVRLAAYAGGIVLDLADADWRAVQIDKTGWQILDRSPVRFIRRGGMLALPSPVGGGSVDDLRDIVNLPGDGDWALALAWLVAALRPSGPYPILEVTGEQGSAKSTLCRVLRALIDPNAAPIRAEPREGRDLMIAASNGWILGFDNLSGVSPWLSDALCRLSTGGGFATRELYSDAEERIFDAMRPILVNGIEAVAIRSDLADRAVRLTLPTIPESKRRPEAELWSAFDAARPGILGALLDAVAKGLRRLPSVRLERLPRMADFATWAVACESGLGLQDGAFMAAYADNRASANSTAIEASPVGPAILATMADRPQWSGTAADLLGLVSDDRYSTETARRQRDWPKTARKLSGALRRLAPNLRAAGIDVSFGIVGRRNTRTIFLSAVGEQPFAPFAPFADGHGGAKNAVSRAVAANGANDRLFSAPAHRSHENGTGGVKNAVATDANGANGIDRDSGGDFRDAGMPDDADDGHQVADRLGDVPWQEGVI